MANYCKWYDDDLQLAAELGKNLLQKNQDLEVQLHEYYNLYQEQQQEIDLLKKQLTILKNVNESRMKIYEEVDKNCHDLERKVEILSKENSQLKIEKNQIFEIKSKSKESKREPSIKITSSSGGTTNANKSLKCVKNKLVQSSPNLFDALCVDNRQNIFGSNVFSGFPSTQSSSQPSNPNNVIKNLEVKFNIEKSKKKKLELELQSALRTITQLQEKLSALQESYNMQDKNKEDKDDDSTSASLLQIDEVIRDLKTKCNYGEVRSQSLIATPLLNDDLLENDNCIIKGGKVLKMKCGGSAYGSLESLEAIGLDILGEDSTSEPCSSILAAAYADERIKKIDNRSYSLPIDKSSTLLGELEEQYRKLVLRYESLIETKSSQNQKYKKLDVGTQDNLVHRKDLYQTIDLNSPLDPTEGHFENSPPEYKRLFKEMFETLRKSHTSNDS